MFKKILFLFLTIVVMNFGAIFAQEPTITGRWKTIDDKTGKEKSVVLVWVDEKGVLHGKIEKVFRKPDEDQNPLCDKCTGDKKDAPMIGMEILWDFHETNKKSSTEWNSGKILDPKNGTTYSCNLILDKAGEKLQVRGFVGFSFIGRTQNWVRLATE